MSYRIQLRRDKAAFWAQADPILAQGELAWSTDTGELKIGDGETPWSELTNILAGGTPALADGFVFKDPLEDTWAFEYPYPASTTSSGGPANGGISFDATNPESVTEIQVSKEFFDLTGSDTTDAVTYLSIHNLIAVHDITRGGASIYRVNSSIDSREGHLMLYVGFVAHQEDNALGSLDETTGPISLTLGMVYRAENGQRVWDSSLVDFPFWDNMSNYEPNFFYQVNHEEGDDEDFEYRRLYFSPTGEYVYALTPVIPENTLVIPMFGNPANDEVEDTYFNKNPDQIAALKAMIKDSSGFYKTMIALGGTPQNSLFFKHGGGIEESRVVFAFTGTADGESETFPEIFVSVGSSTNDRDDREWMDNTEFAFINNSNSIVVLDPENAGYATVPPGYISITFDKAYTLEANEFVLLRYDHHQEIFRQEKQAVAGGISQSVLDAAVAPLSIIPKPISIPVGYRPEITSTGTGWEPFSGSLLGGIMDEAIQAVNDGASMVLEINLNYYLKPNGTQPQVRLKIGNIEVKLPAGNIPGVDSFLYFDGTVTLFISKSSNDDVQIKAMTRFRSYETYSGGALQDDLVHFPGDYLGNDEYTLVGDWDTDGAWPQNEIWMQFNAEIGVKARVEKASGQYSLAL